MTLEPIKSKIRSGEYRYSRHAIQRMVEKKINKLEVEYAILNGEIIEEYPNDKYSPSCLVYGRTERERPLHVQVSQPPVVVVVTTYEPDPEEWIDFKVRR